MVSNFIVFSRDMLLYSSMPAEKCCLSPGNARQYNAGPLRGASRVVGYNRPSPAGFGSLSGSGSCHEPDHAMNILALDTSTEHCSAALWRDGTVYERTTRAGQSHSTILNGMVDAVLAEGGLRLAMLDGIAYGQGPGSFTGLRIACAVAQGLAFPSDIPVAGIGTLHAMAAACGAEKVVCCLDARMQEIYHATYVRDGEHHVETSAPRVCAPLAVPPLDGEGWTGCGNGFAAYPLLQQRWGAALSSVNDGIYPQARDIARLSLPLFAAGHGVRAEDAAPLYIRDKVALKTAER
jgi:tRNA threonylcarbamoyladenosine biosynthesis protein TsaB